MKNLLPHLSALLLIACGGKGIDNSTDYTNMKVTLDTVIVDPGEDIINLKNGIWRSTLARDNRVMYLWDDAAKDLSVIDLDKLILEKKIKFANDGPDGVGNYVIWLQSMENENLMLADFDRYRIFDLQAKKLEEINLRNDEFGGDGLKEDENLNRKPVILNGGKLFFGTFQDWTNHLLSFAKLDFEQKLVKKYELPGRDKLADYSIMMKSGQMTMATASDNVVSKVEDRIILSSSAYADLFVLDLVKDSLYRVSYLPKLTKASKKGGYPSELDSEKEFRNLMRQIQEEVSFTPPIWDSSTKRFYRISYLTNFPEHLENEDIKSEYSVFLTVLDENFNILGETAVEGIKHFPSNPFVKDGEIWIYLNVDDELGFVKMKIN